MIGRCYQSKNGDDMTKLNLTAFLSKQEKWQKAGKKKYNFPGEVSMFMHEIRMSESMYARKKTSRRHRDSVELVGYEIIYMSFD